MSDPHTDVFGAAQGAEPAPGDANSHAMTELQAAQEASERRAAELQLAADVAKAASSVLDPDELVQQAVHLIRDRFELYYVGLFLADDAGQWAILRAGTGEAGEQMVSRGHRLAVGGQSMIGWSVANSQPRIAFDVGHEAVRFDNPLLPLTRTELALPLLSRGRAIGALTIQSTQAAAFDDEDIGVLRTLADQLATSIDNARLFADRERRLAEMAVVTEIGRALSSAMVQDELLELVYQQVGRLFDTTNFYIALYEEGSDVWLTALQVEGGVRLAPEWQPLGAGLTGHILRTRQSLVFSNADEILTFLNVQGRVALDEVARSWLAVPLIAADNCVGVMCIQNYVHDELYGEHDLALFTTVAGQVAAAIANLRLLAGAQQRARQMEAINEVGRAITSVLDVDSLLLKIVDITKERFGYYFVGIALVEGDNIVFRSGSTIGDTGARLQERLVDVRLDSEHGLIAAVASTGQPLLVEDVSADPRYLAVPGGLMAAVRAELDVPIRAKGQVIGVLTVQNDQPFGQHAEQQTIPMLQALADQAGTAVDNARLFASAQRAEAEQRRRSDELAALYQVSMELGMEQRDLNTMLDTISRRAMALLASDGGGVWLWREDEQELELVVDYQPGGVHLAGRRLKPGVGLTGKAFIQKRIQVVDDYLAWSGHAGTFADAPFSAGMAAPMIWQNQVIGALVVTRSQRDLFYGPAEQALAELLAAQATTFIQNARLFEQARLQARELDILNEMGRALSGTLNVRLVADAAYRHAAQLMDVTNFYIAQHDASRQVLSFPIFMEEGAVLTRQDRPTGNGLTEYVIRTGEPLLIREDLQGWLAGQGVDTVGRLAECWLGAPMFIGERVTGIVAVQSYEAPRLFDERDQDVLVAIARQVAVAIESARLFEEQERTAALLANRVRQIECLSDIGQRIGETPPVPAFLAWVAARIPEAMQYPDVCVAAVEFEGQTYGVPDAPKMQSHIVQSLQVGGVRAGRLVIAYREPHEFLDEESALLGDISRRASGYVENQRLFQETQARAAWESRIRAITDRIRRGVDTEAILRIGTEELGRMLGMSTVVVRLGSAEQLAQANPEASHASGAGERASTGSSTHSQPAVNGD